MENFTPSSAAIGGALLGIAVTILWAFNGRTAGVSGIFGGLYPPRRGERWWRLAFLIGLPVGAAIGAALAPRLLAEVPSTLPEVDMAPVVAIVAGLLVGIGTRIKWGLYVRAWGLWPRPPVAPLVRGSRRVHGVRCRDRYRLRHVL